MSLNGARVLGGDAELGSGGYGVLLSDQTFPEESAIPMRSRRSAGSAASLDVSVVKLGVPHQRIRSLDRDGLRVNEGGAGAGTLEVLFF